MTTLDDILTGGPQPPMKPGIAASALKAALQAHIDDKVREARIDELNRFPYDKYWSNIKMYKDERLAQLTKGEKG